MGKTWRLCIYDSADENSKDMALDRDADARIGVDSVESFRDGLDNLLASGQKFKRLVFDTHGSPGCVYFGKYKWTKESFTSILGNRGYEQLFPFYSKMYFSGCNVGEDETGWQFLEEVNRIFFGTYGGVSLAFDSVGFAVRWTAVKPKHIWGDVKYVVREPGKPPRRYDSGDFVSDMMRGRLNAKTLKLLDVD